MSSWGPQQRSQILSEFFALHAEMEGLDRSSATFLAVRDRSSALADAYREGLPRVPLSRCPFSGALVAHSFDPYGTDGLWWRHDSPVRPRETGLSPHHLVFSGALRWQKPVAVSPFLVRTGPEVPFVIPRLLTPGVRVVLSSAEVGACTAYLLFYYTTGAGPSISPVNAWPTSERAPSPVGRLVLSEDPPVLDSELDFDLAPYIDRGQLLWIAPSDDLMTLRTDDCPYLDLPGRRETLYCQDGSLWGDPSELEG